MHSKAIPPICFYRVTNAMYLLASQEHASLRHWLKLMHSFLKAIPPTGCYWDTNAMYPHANQKDASLHHAVI